MGTFCYSFILLSKHFHGIAFIMSVCPDIVISLKAWQINLIKTDMPVPNDKNLGICFFPVNQSAI